MWFNALVELKKKSGKTLKQISEESKVPLGTLNKLFSGQTKDPKLETVQAVVHALGYTLDDLDDHQSEKNPPSTAEAALGEPIGPNKQALLDLVDGMSEDEMGVLLEVVKATLKMRNTNDR